eukprot:14352350-Ditylum_brightwellii.AAC.1
MCLITTDQYPTCSYKEIPAENTKDAAKAFKAVCNGNMDIAQDDDNEKDITDEHLLRNYCQ